MGGSNCIVTAGKMQRPEYRVRIHGSIGKYLNMSAEYSFNGQFIYREGGFPTP